MRIDESKWIAINNECVKSSELLSKSFEDLKNNLLLNQFYLMCMNVEHFRNINLNKTMIFKYILIFSNNII